MKQADKDMLMVEKAREESRDRFAPFLWLYILGVSGTVLGILDLHLAPVQSLGLRFDQTVLMVSAITTVIMSPSLVRQLVEELHFYRRINELKRLKVEAIESNVVSFRSLSS